MAFDSHLDLAELAVGVFGQVVGERVVDAVRVEHAPERAAEVVGVDVGGAARLLGHLAQVHLKVGQRLEHVLAAFLRARHGA